MIRAFLSLSLGILDSYCVVWARYQEAGRCSDGRIAGTDLVAGELLDDHAVKRLIFVQ